MTTLHKQAQRKLLKDGRDTFGEPVKAPKWKNVVFTKDGKSYLGPMVWDSEASAVDGLNACLGEIGKPDSNGAPYNVISVIGGPIKSSDGVPSIWAREYSYALQMPIGGQS